MATTFKNFINSDVTSTRTLLHESIPITGSIASGTYYETAAPDSETNIKNYSHGLFQSVYDYPYLSSSANHIFDLTIGYSSNSDYSGSTGTRLQTADKINMYNQMAQILCGHDVDGSIRKFDRDGDLAGGSKMKEVFFINFARLLTKDEIKKGSFKLQVITGSSPNDPALDRKNNASTSNSATAVVKIVSATPADFESGGQTAIVLTSTDGTVKTYQFANGGALATGGVVSSNVIRVQVSGLSAQGTIAAELKTAIEHSNGHGTAKLTVVLSTVTNANDTATITQYTAGIQGNTAIPAVTNGNASDLTVNGAIAVTTFLNGHDNSLFTLQDWNAVNSYKINSPSGEYGILYSASADGGASDKGLGHIYYQAGIAVVTASIFRSVNATAGGLDVDYTVSNTGENPRNVNESYFGWLPGLVHGTDTLPTSSVGTMFQSASISGSCSGFRNALYNIEFNNTTELNSTIYFCRAGHNEFNYSSNPTYISDSKIRVKDSTLDQPVSYITTIGLYSSDNELLAVAKLSEPIKKTPDNELTFRVRLDY